MMNLELKFHSPGLGDEGEPDEMPLTLHPTGLELSGFSLPAHAGNWDGIWVWEYVWDLYDFVVNSHDST